MTERSAADVTVLFLHGRGVPGPGRRWLDLVQEGLKASLGTVQDSERHVRVDLVAPSYAKVTGHSDGRRPQRRSMTVPDPLPRGPWGDARDVRRSLGGPQYERTLTVLWSQGSMRKAPNTAFSVAGPWYSKRMQDFQDYLREPGKRGEVRKHLQSYLPEGGRLVVVAHSQGTLVALDLISAVPHDVSVEGLITLGSPLAYNAFHSLVDGHHLGDAAGRARSWVNLADPDDVVTGGAALRTSWAPAARAIDVSVDNSRFSSSRHDGDGYLQQPAFQVALGMMVAGHDMAFTDLRRPWRLPAEVARVGVRVAGRDDATVSFRSRLSAIGQAWQSTSPASTHSRPFGEWPLVAVTENKAVTALACVTCGLLGARGADRANMTTLLQGLWHGLPPSSVIGRIVERAFSWQQYADRFGYRGLPVESGLWPRGLTLVGPGTPIAFRDYDLATLTEHEWMFLAMAHAVIDHDLNVNDGKQLTPASDLALLGCELGFTAQAERFIRLLGHRQATDQFGTRRSSGESVLARNRRILESRRSARSKRRADGLPGA